MIRATDIHSLTEFTRNARGFIQKLKKSKSPIAITINGSAEAVIQDAESYQATVDELEKLQLLVALQQAEADFQAGRFTSVAEARMLIREQRGI